MFQKLFVALIFISVPYAALGHQEGGVMGCPARGGEQNLELEVFALVNRQRAKQNRPVLEWDARLARVARDYSVRMAREGFFAHFDPDGRSVIERAAKIKGWSKIGENLFVGDPAHDLPSFAIKGWLKSPTHRTNMLDPAWTGTGIGVAVSDEGQVYITEIFIRN